DRVGRAARAAAGVLAERRVRRARPLYARARLARGADRSRVRRRLGARPRAREPAVLLVLDLRPRGEVRLQSRHPANVRHRRRDRRRPRGGARRTAARRRPLALRLGRTPGVALVLGARDRVDDRRAVRRTHVDHAALQPLHEPAERPAPGCALAIGGARRLPARRRVGDRRLEAVHQGERVLHRLRVAETDCTLRHAARDARAGRGAGGRRARDRALQAAARAVEPRDRRRPRRRALVRAVARDGGAGAVRRVRDRPAVGARRVRRLRDPHDADRPAALARAERPLTPPRVRRRSLRRRRDRQRPRSGARPPPPGGRYAGEPDAAPVVRRAAPLAPAGGGAGAGAGIAEPRRVLTTALPDGACRPGTTLHQAVEQVAWRRPCERISLTATSAAPYGTRVRVLMWSELFWPYVGGTEVLGAVLMVALRKRGHEFLVLTSQDSLELPGTDRYDGIPIQRLPLRAVMSGRELGRLRDIRREVAAIKATFAPDLVHANGVGPSLLIHLQTGDAWAAPWVLTLQQELLPSQLSPGESLLHRAVSSAAWVAACSEAVLTQARELAPEIASRSSVIRNTVDAPGPSPTRTREWNRLFCIGRLVPAKGFDVALTAVASLRARFPGLRLIIAGDGPMRRELETMAAELGLGHA